jgi:hypothetical protein
MSPRRNVPPFEIMGASPPTPPTFPGSGAPRVSMGQRMRGVVGGLTPDRLGQWWANANAPVVMRIPRGYLVLAAVGVLVLMALAYWVGGVRGYNRVISELQAGDGPGAMVRRGEVSIDDPAHISPAKGQPLRDPRQPGMNYLIVATYPLEEAERLIAFLRDKQVDAIGIPSDTRRTMVRVVILKGFDRSEVRDTPDSPGTRFKDEMRRIGRQWKAHNGGRGDDLASMYFSRYDSPSP